MLSSLGLFINVLWLVGACESQVGPTHVASFLAFSVPLQDKCQESVVKFVLIFVVFMKHPHQSCVDCYERVVKSTDENKKQLSNSRLYIAITRILLAKTVGLELSPKPEAGSH